MRNNYLLIRMLLVKYNREMGRRYCCVPGCSNTSKTVKDGTKVFLHRLPMSGKKKNIKQQWIRRLRNVRTDLIINDHTRVIFASQVSDSLALIYPLADLVGFSKPSQ